MGAPVEEIWVQLAPVQSYTPMINRFHGSGVSSLGKFAILLMPCFKIMNYKQKNVRISIAYYDTDVLCYNISSIRTEN